MEFTPGEGDAVGCVGVMEGVLDGASVGTLVVGGGDGACVGAGEGPNDMAHNAMRVGPLPHESCVPAAKGFPPLTW